MLVALHSNVPESSGRRLENVIEETESVKSIFMYESVDMAWPFLVQEKTIGLFPVWEIHCNT